MSRYSDQVRDEYGRTVPGVSIYVYKWDADLDAAGDLETLTDDLSAPLANPLTSDADGLFYFNSADGQKLIEYHFGGKVEFRDLILVGPVPVPQAVFGGFFTAASALSIPVGMDAISTTGYSSLGVGEANYIYDVAVNSAYVTANPRSSFMSANARGFRLDHEQDFTPQMFGAVADGATDDYPAFAAALAYLAAFALNNGSVFYNGSPSLFIPAGKYRSSTAIDVTHTVIIEGEGSGQFGPGSFGCSHVKFDAATDGFRFQAANTSGNTTIDSPDHNGSGGAVIRDICLEGGFNGTTESDHHGLVIRNAIKAERLYIKNWPGEGVKAWAGTVIGFGSVSGNVSTTMLTGVKTEGNRGGIDIRGSDANVVTTINCEGYQNRQFGLIDDNGAGSNTHIGFHAASNGVVTGTWPQTQCSYSGRLKALKWGGDPTVAPSTDTTDTANWYDITAGAAVTNLIPAWVNTPNTFRAGGDYLTLNSASAVLLNPYSETGGFSQFSTGTQIFFGTMTSQYFRGGTQEVPLQSGGKAIKSGRLNCYVSLQTDANEAGVSTANYDGSGTGFGSLGFTRTGGAILNSVGAGLSLQQAGVGIGVIDNTGVHGVASVTSISGGVGYATGAGGAVTQLTSRTTGVTLNKTCGAITLFSAAGTATWQSFTVTNSTVAATDVVRVVQKSGTDLNMIHVTNVAAGSFKISFATTGGTTTEQPVFSFAILKAVAA